MHKAIIIVPNLADLVGHAFEYTRSVSAAFKRRGYTIQVLGSTDATSEVKALEGFIPAFRRTNKPRATPAGLAEILWQGLIFFKDLRNALSASAFDKDDLIFAHTIPHPHFLGWAWCLRLFRDRLPKTALLFRYSLGLGYRSRREMYRLVLPYIYRFLFWMIERGQGHPLFLVDSEELLQEYQRLTPLPIKVVPIPLDVSDIERVLHQQTQDLGNENHRHLIYLGDARRGKGFDLLPPLFEELTKNPCNKIKITIHAGRPAEQCVEPEVVEAFLHLERLAKTKDIHLIRANLSRSDYLKLLCSADAVLLPCRQEHYMGQTSNVFAEAFAAGKPVVAPSNTWMGRQILTTGAGTVFESGHLGSLVRATDDLLQNITKYTYAANLQRDRWIAFHNANRLVDEFIGTVPL